MTLSPSIRITVVAICFAVLQLSHAGEQPARAAGAIAPPSAEAYYSSAIAAMQQLPEPTNARFTLSLFGSGLDADVIKDAKGRAQIAISSGSGTASKAYPVFFDARTRTATVTLTSGDAPSDSALFDPTWLGSHAWLERGMDNSARVAARMASPEPNTASPGPVQKNPKTIAVVYSIGNAYYTVADAGPRRCADGAMGHALRLSARRDPAAHPLTGVVIDPTSMRFCAMSFALRGASGSIGYTGSVRLNYGNAGGYWMVRNGVIDIEARFLGFGLKHYVVHFSYDNPTFH
ncbi:MAG: hypothetical protein ACYDHD_07320 [Vulcanimicrobiaceae bacterium]